MATYYSFLDWKTPWAEETGGYLQSMGLQRVGHDEVTKYTWVTIDSAINGP